MVNDDTRSGTGNRYAIIGYRNTDGVVHVARSLIIVWFPTINNNTTYDI